MDRLWLFISIDQTYGSLCCQVIISHTQHPVAVVWVTAVQWVNSSIKSLSNSSLPCGHCVCVCVCGFRLTHIHTNWQPLTCQRVEVKERTAHEKITPSVNKKAQLFSCNFCLYFIVTDTRTPQWIFYTTTFLVNNIGWFIPVIYPPIQKESNGIGSVLIPWVWVSESILGEKDCTLNVSTQDQILHNGDKPR